MFTTDAQYIYTYFNTLWFYWCLEQAHHFELYSPISTISVSLLNVDILTFNRVELNKLEEREVS